MSLAARVVNGLVRQCTDVLCRVDAPDLGHVPSRGPLIVVANHINFIEIPVLYTRLLPRPMTSLAKSETWDNPFLGRLFDLWQVIPLERDSADRAALSAALDYLDKGYILAVAPEGTRSGDGRLQRGNPGVTFLALHSNAPILPIVYYGSELLWSKLRRLRRTDFHIRVGQPFFLDLGNARPSRRTRSLMTDEIMYQMAALLPPQYRGAYATLEQATESHLRFPPGSRSNLLLTKDQY
jgi:1-acyl-sn-glycerol-3-phosphate acyltransferase